MRRFFLSTGDPSAVDIGVSLMRVLKERVGDLEFVGLGGPPMIEQGMRLIYDPASTSAMWLWGNLSRIPAHRRALALCVEDWKQRRPDLIITIDYQGFHLHMGTAARALGIPVLHFVGSQFWGRRYYTFEPIRRAYSHVLLIHEFEKAYYDEAGIPATFVGHPVFERLQQRGRDQALTDRLRALPGPRLGILPGSRHGEIRHSLPTMLAAARRLKPTPNLLVSVGRPESRALIEKLVQRSGLPYELLERSSAEVLSAADVALMTSGSVSMEAIYFRCPCVVIYRLSLFSYFIAKPHITSDIAQPNVVARRRIVPEFLLPRKDGKRVARATQQLFDDPQARETQKREFSVIKERLLAGPRPSEAAADVALRMIG